MSINSSKILILTALTLGMSACSNNNMSALSKKNEVWTLSEIQYNGTPLKLGDSQISLSFADGSAMVGKSSVNTYRLPVKISSGYIDHTGPLISTRMAGTMAAMKLENTYFTILSQADKLDRESEKLTIDSQDGHLVYHLQVK